MRAVMSGSEGGGRRVIRADLGARTMIFVALLLARPAFAWLATVNGTAPPADVGEAVAFDPAGAVVVLGSTNELGAATVLTVAKVAPDGQELWRRHLTGTQLRRAEDGASPGDIVVDAIGDVVVVGALPYVGNERDVVVAKLAGATGAELWRVVVAGTAQHDDYGTAVALDPAGDVVVTGELWNAATSRDVLVLKLAAASGTERWRRVLDGPAHASDSPGGVAVDDDGNVAVAATLHNGPTGLDLVVTRLSGATGAPLWGPVSVDEGSGDRVQAVAVDRAHNVIVAGTLQGADGSADFAVVKFSFTGAEVWRYVLAGTAEAFDLAVDVAVDFTGDVFALGTVESASSGRDIVLEKLAWADGHRIWGQAILGSAGSTDTAMSLAVDPAGFVAVAGLTENETTGGDFTVARYTGAGVPVWVRVLQQGSELGYEYARAVAVDPSGGVAAAGTLLDPATGFDAHTVLYASVSGDMLWQHSMNGSGNDSADAAAAVTVDAAGDVIAAGTTREGVIFPGTMSMMPAGLFTVAAFDGATGALRWQRDLRGTTAESAAAALAVATDATGDVVAGGSMRNRDAGPDFTVVKLDHADGRERWRSTASGHADEVFAEAAYAVAVDAAGDVFAAGAVADAAPGLRFAVRKLDGASGAERWLRLVAETATAGTNDRAHAVVVDAAGDAVACGAIRTDGGGAQDFAVVKLSGATGEVRWRVLLDESAGGDACNAVTADAAGDVVAAGRLGTPGGGGSSDLLVAKLDGATGAERWRVLVDGAAADSGDSARAVGVDPSGDVVVAGTTEPSGDLAQYVVLKLAGTDGTERWRATFAGAATGGNGAAALAVDAAGDVVTIGQLTSAPGVSTAFAVKIGGTTGAEQWRHLLPGTAAAFGSGVGVALDGGGNPALLAYVENAGTEWDIAVAKLSGATGGASFCGDGVQDAGERCDDANGAGGDCCSPTCEPTEVPGVCGGPCTTVAECDDADPCTSDVCDASGRCVHDQLTGDAAVTCAFERPLIGAACTSIPRRIAKRFARARRLAQRAVAVERPARRQALVRATLRALTQTERLVDRAERSRRAARRIPAECAAALRTIVGDARARVDGAARLGTGGA